MSVNDTATSSQVGTNTAHAGSRPVRGAQAWIVRDNDDKPWGPFTTADEARTWAAKKWPNIPQYDEATFDGHGCWEIEALWTPTD